MSIRSKRMMLFATVFVPAFSVSISVQPVMSETLEPPVLLAQDNGEPTSEGQDLRQQQEDELRRAQEEAQRAADEQQRAAEEENRRQAEEQKRAVQEEADRQAIEQQRAAEQARQAAEEDQRAIEQQRQQAEQARQESEQQQRAAEEEMRRNAEAEQKAAKEEAAKHALEQEKAAEDAKRKAAEQQANEDKQRATEEEARRKAAEEPAPQEVEQQSAPQVPTAPADEPLPAPETPSQEDTTEQPQQPSNDAQPLQSEVPPQPEQSIDQPSTPPKGPEGASTQPLIEQPIDPNPRVQQTIAPVPAPEIVDERTNDEKQAIAKDPAKSDETVVLPVDNGAAILDSDKDADSWGGNKSREDRRKQREQQRASEENTAPPVDDASAQVAIPEALKADLSEKIEANLKQEGTRIDAAPAFAVPETTNIINNTVINNTVVNNTTLDNINNNVTNVKVIEQVDNRVILGAGDRIFVRGDDRPRLRRDAERTYYDELPGGRMRETIVRPGGYEIVTVYNRYGDILQRNRIDRDGNDYLMIYAPEYDDGPRAAIVDVGYELPPMRLTVPVRDYIIDVADDPDRDFYDFLARPPVERVERVYTIDEVRHSARVRDKVRRIDLDTIHFATGSAEVSLSQAKTLRKVADAMHKVLQKDLGETFFIEGHTDAIGSDRSNLILSDRRAESVASLLTEVYDIPAENLVTQGYGERFLKIRTQAAEQENRRVTIRRVTPLVRPVAQR
ncbi:OmpA family protein [Ochrobactrum sp. EDr1-4]|uniref:OmpA family protein n=1 Tax=Ochrobactrum sp. EDr1-4 TaxID=3368622 RepID=UPI003B9FDB19